MTRALLALFLGFSPTSSAQDAPPPGEKPPSENAKLQDLGGGKYELGLVSIDQTTRTISFPATLNMTEGKLEFAIVHEQGKIHEALLITKVNAFNLNVALKLLRYQESPELFQIVDEDYRPTGKYHEVSDKTKEAARVAVTVSWKNPEGATKTSTLNKWILHVPSKKAVPDGPWIYGGSYIHNGAFQAKAQGELVALFTSNTSLFNHPGSDHHLDDVWEPNPQKLPDLGTPLTVILKPYSKTTK